MHQKQRQLRKSYPHLVEKDFVGMKSDLDQLVSLVAGNDNVDPDRIFILIKGMGGQGKTTIAKKIYNHSQVRNRFEAFAWVCISQEFNPKNVFQDILGVLSSNRSKDDIMIMGDSELVEELYKVQQERKCLVVLDDIWSNMNWKILSPAFPTTEACGSKILVTSRNLKVGFVHQLKGLTEDEGWELLQKKAFSNKNDAQDFRMNNPEFEKLGRNMVRRCGGLPLVIAVLGGLLNDKSSSKEWEMVNKDIGSFLSKGDEIEEDYGAVNQVLAISYNDLPYFLKRCFIYMSHFPEDAVINVDTLYLLWITEGLIPCEDRGEGETIMDQAERYLGELVERSMVQVEMLQPFTEFKLAKMFDSCCLHDLMRVMSLSKGIKEGFLKIIDSRVRRNEFSTFMTTTSCTTKTRRLSIYLNEDTHVYVPSGKDETTRLLRSLVIFGNVGQESKASLPLEILGIKEFKFLRFLHFDGCDFKKKSLQGIKELLHLRYLSFRDCVGIMEFPSDIGDLQYLESLDLLSNGSKDLIIPNVLWKLKRLKYLILPDSFCTKDGKKLKLGFLTNLEVIYSFLAYVCDANDLSTLTNLQVVKRCQIDKLEDLKIVTNYLKLGTHHPLLQFEVTLDELALSSDEELGLLKELLCCPILYYLYADGKIYKLPAYDEINAFSSVTRIYFIGMELQYDPMRTLEKLPNLLFICRQFSSVMHSIK